VSKLRFYEIYLTISSSVTIWVGMTLRSSGRKFLRSSFESADLADTVNQMLQIGFYLANIGYIAVLFRTYDALDTTQSVLEAGIPKLGGVFLILGLVHLFNMLIIAKMRRGSHDVRPSSSAHVTTHTPAKVLEEAYHLRSEQKAIREEVGGDPAAHPDGGTGDLS
jgi:hypothetical protein